MQGYVHNRNYLYQIDVNRSSLYVLWSCRSPTR